MPCKSISKKIESFGLKVFETNGHNMKDITDTLEKALKHKGSPICIIAETVKGKGISFMENERVWHGKAPDRDEYNAAMNELMEALKNE